jgi:RNA polymerase sigma factor (sigma-70 family)
VDNPRAYLYRAVLNASLRSRRTLLRRERREIATFVRDEVVLDEPVPEVLHAIGQLSIRQRAVIVLTYWGDLDPSGVAALLHISDGAVRRHLARGRARLKELLNEP